MSRLTRDGTAEPVSRDQILKHARGQGNISFPFQLTTSRIGNLTRSIHTLLYVMNIHTYIHIDIISTIILLTYTTVVMLGIFGRYNDLRELRVCKVCRRHVRLSLTSEHHRASVVSLLGSPPRFPSCHLIEHASRIPYKPSTLVNHYIYRIFQTAPLIGTV